jgi:L-2-hydroxyglutarate oxidase LhgO
MVIATAPCHLYHIQTAIIGAGIIGLSVARALSGKGHEVLLFEQANSIGSGQSSRNSEVIHAGIYYDKNAMPLKSKLCVEGRRLLYEYCRERNVPHNQCGKLLVATDVKQKNVGLPRLIELAKRNGVNDIQVLSREEIADMEPNINCTGGAYSPSTGIVDSHALMTSLLSDAEENGATTLALQCNVNGGRIIPTASEKRGNIILHVGDSDIACDNVVICAGLASDKIATSILSSCSTTPATYANEVTTSQLHRTIPKQYYAKGNYFRLINQKSPFTRLVYPLPDPSDAGLGVHATIDLSNSTRFGPDVEWLDPTSTDLPENIDMNVDPTRVATFYTAVRKYWSGLQGEEITHSMI